MKVFKFKTRIALVFFAFYLTLSVFSIGYFYTQAISAQKDQIRERLMQVSALVASSVSPEKIDRIDSGPEGMKTQEYGELVYILRRAQKGTPDVSDLYVLSSSDRPGIMRFVANADPEDILECGEEIDVTHFPEIANAFKAPSADKKITKDRWGYWLSGYAPIKHFDGRLAGIVGVDISVDTLAAKQAEIRKAAIYNFLLGMILSFFVGILASIRLSR